MAAIANLTLDQGATFNSDVASKTQTETHLILQVIQRLPNG